MLVFVYGTLKSGQPNHSLLTAADTGQAELVAPAVTRRRLPLVIASRLVMTSHCVTALCAL